MSYASVCTRPDISRALGHLSRHIAYSSALGAGQESAQARDVSTRRSRTRYTFMMNGATVSWRSIGRGRGRQWLPP
eukprot:scaffold551276_cov18-Prasinocladus_malaysianus.AAC.1